ncbi:tRNA (adenosine(37)-N6)-threonylcarbamoyltransferase complex dimerization subunit type 1 TsaB [Xanthomonas citri pv. fuscans CFBP 6996]|uniref:tRNA (adenosine(37)-N6)-threonylcarbamoyltransferase complex dimerization subunit type 1 TsaB n=1 Tax=Xanthomonas citri TaxID=346 RepID=UPI000C188F85|nr:tRNA (adenosine(37)-N6)-threonylcarbamoyltransferase complex dimerization subunit type 1 TsaB [Xanthomonas citri]ATS52642.1 tRNA (adenosine(37)-N6)-threonylcarbamoyltransferase complex dimerization subunit type 1 TsaB [Xanthomonas citri pv. phaseoli var. fuscans]ATS54522.1 tRNA (adenosine(37)-N6)-threonylcarbamoyltransferase complex dimerization subunit type 1 TsaB [Xanthomonas citri pv. phaseoli var. fuscans]ATS61477.1 tRNA (adenosine(37)-N6)-threonylcarbamoyltransferase complex dimerization
MNVLAFETSTEACSVALHVHGRVIERFELAPRRHAELALPWAEQLLADAGIARRQLDAIAVGRGPGAFTGVRLAIGLAQGIALALDLPVLAVSTLQVLALRAPAEASQVLACIDARMGEVYAGVFARNGDTLLDLAPEVVCAPDALVLPDTGAAVGIAGVGTGLAAADALLQQRFAARLTSVDAAALPRAADLLTLAVPALRRGEGVAPERVEPAYLRDNVALTLVEQQAARAAKAAGATP